ncbi:MAG: hypothetical protein K9K39_10485 [Desulfohalobiaceae bacterium]|nr:hypothetical protein [Desulfohalobiaceae bacterium]
MLVRSEDKDGNREQFLRRLQELFCSLDGGRADPAERRGGVPPGFGWTESEAEYRKAQAAWLSGTGRSGKRKGRGLLGETGQSSGDRQHEEDE